jgi:hypothetical protein
MSLPNLSPPLNLTVSGLFSPSNASHIHLNSTSSPSVSSSDRSSSQTSSVQHLTAFTTTPTPASTLFQCMNQLFIRTVSLIKDPDMEVRVCIQKNFFFFFFFFLWEFFFFFFFAWDISF